MLVGLVMALALVGCGVSAGSESPGAAEPSGTGLRYVALGDSYTIGTSVEMADRFPNQLVAALGPDEPTLRLVANLGVNGYTSADLIGKELPALDALDPAFVTVLIGVNDVVQGVPIDTYRANAVTILDALRGRLPADRIVTLAVPDYTVTPSGADYGDPRQQHDGIVATNDVMGQLSEARGIVFVDTFDLSLRAADDRSLVAGDGLHPSGAQYGLWVERLVPVVRRLLGPSAG
jgi:acyl-CoA thioesterase-1